MSAATNPSITFKVVYGESETFFKLKRSAHISKSFAAFAKKMGHPVDYYEFLYQGRPIPDDATADSLEMQEGNFIKAKINSRRSPTRKSDKPEPENPLDPEAWISITVAQEEFELVFKVRRNTPMKKIREKFAKMRGKDVKTLRFMYYDDRLNDSSTADQLEMEAHKDEVNVFNEVDGGVC